MSSLPATFAQGVIDQAARAQFEVFLNEHRAALNGCLDALTEEQTRRSLVVSRTTLLALVKHATFIEKVWFDEAVTGRSRVEIDIPATPEKSFVLDDGDTVGSVQRAHRAACEPSRRATSSLGVGRQGPWQPARPAPAALDVFSPCLRVEAWPFRAGRKRVCLRANGSFLMGDVVLDD